MTNLFQRILITSVAVSFLAAPTLTLAATFRAGEQFSLGSSETIADDAYIVSGNSTVAGTIKGDLFIAGGSVSVTGNVAQDIAAAGGSINLLGAVGDDARVAGGNIVIGGAVGGDLLSAGGNVHVLNSARIEHDVAAAGGNITIDGPVRGNLRFSGGTITINSGVAGDVVITANKVVIGEKAVLEKNLTYTSPTAAEIKSGAVVRGKTDFQKQEARGRYMRAGFKAGLAALFGVWLLLKALMFVAAALVIGLLFRNTTAVVVARSKATFWQELLRGIAIMVLGPIVSIIALATIIGIPLGLVGLAVLFLLFLLAMAYMPVLAASLLMRYFKPQATLNWMWILLGAVVLIIIEGVPLVGWIINFALFAVALGSLGREVYLRLWPAC